MAPDHPRNTAAQSGGYHRENVGIYGCARGVELVEDLLLIADKP